MVALADKDISFYRTPNWVSDRGLQIARINFRAKNEDIAADIFVESHQGKHSIGNWHYTGMRGNTFSAAIATTDRPEMFQIVALIVQWAWVYENRTGVDKFISFQGVNMNNTAITQTVHVQASYDRDRKFFAFHCYPDETRNPELIVSRHQYLRGREIILQKTRSL
jgi:hypothetical protein